MPTCSLSTAKLSLYGEIEAPELYVLPQMNKQMHNILAMSAAGVFGLVVEASKLFIYVQFVQTGTGVLG